MTQTVKPTKSKSPSETPHSDPDVLTLEEAAAFLRVTAEDLERAVRADQVPALRLGNAWRFSLGALRDALSGKRTMSLPGKQAMLELAGRFQDDPDLESIVKDAYRRRVKPRPA